MESEKTIAAHSMKDVRERFLARRDDDHFGFEAHEYCQYCGFDWLKKNDVFKKGIRRTKKNIKEYGMKIYRESIIKQMKDYMSFAYGKADGERGLSSGRSIQHYIAWAWLAGDVEFSNRIDEMSDREYSGYGMSILKSISEYYGWVWDEVIKDN